MRFGGFMPKAQITFCGYAGKIHSTDKKNVVAVERIGVGHYVIHFTRWFRFKSWVAHKWSKIFR